MLKLINQNRQEFVIILALLLITLFLRIYKIDSYMTFLGDEGRDALMIKRILDTADIPLIGPPTSVGNMYLGPLYYYMMTVPMTIAWLNPVAAAVMVALLGTASVGLIYFFARTWFGKVPAIAAAVLYAISPVNIIYSRSSWNPNPAPFFALTALLGLYLARKKNDFRYFILTGISLAFVVQMHYLALILLPVFGSIWLYQFYSFYKLKSRIKYFWLGTTGGIAAFCILMSPLLLFDLRHNWMNFRAISTFFSNRETTVNLNLFNSIGRLPKIYSDTLLDRYMGGQEGWAGILLAILLLVPIVFFLYKSFKNKRIEFVMFVLTVWAVGGILGLSLYKQTVYDHYLGFLNPAVYLLYAALIGMILNVKKKYRIIATLVVMGLTLPLIYFNLAKSPLLIPPNNQLKRTEEVAEFIINQSEGKPFNFALIAEHNYDAAYQFVLDVKGHKPLQVPFDITDQLFVVCEDAVCNPVGHPKYEIAAFGWSKIETEQEIQGVKVFKLGHNNSAGNVSNTTTP